jgi:hypothetical protein
MITLRRPFQAASYCPDYCGGGGGVDSIGFGAGGGVGAVNPGITGLWLRLPLAASVRLMPYLLKVFASN